MVPRVPPPRHARSRRWRARPTQNGCTNTRYTLTGFPDNIDLQASLALFANVGVYQEPRLEPVFAVQTTQTFDHADVGDSLLLFGFTRRTDDSITIPQIGDQQFYVRTPAAPAISLATPVMRWLFRPAIDAHGPSPDLRWIQEGTDTTTLGWLSLNYHNPGDSQHTGIYLWDVVGPVLGPGIANQQTLGVYTLPQLPDPRLRLSVFGEPRAAFVRALAINPEVSYDQLRPVLARELDFELGCASSGLFINLRGLFGLPAVTDVRFSSSRAGTGVIQ